jgi:hypothetical protein
MYQMMGSVDGVEHCKIYMYLPQSLMNEYTTTIHARMAYNSRLWHRDIRAALALALDVAQHYENADAEGCTVIQ